MKRLAIIALLVSLALSAPVTNETDVDDDKITIDKDFFADEFKVYTAEHDIIQITVPLNALNFGDDSDEDDNAETDDSIVFFVEADIQDGVKDYKGLFVLKNKTATQLLEKGTDASADNGDTKVVFFSATDGLYTYNNTINKAEKYGTITDNIISLAKVNGTDMIYILTNTNELYKVTDEGTKKEKVDAVVGAQQIVLDYSSNLYYYDSKKEAYVYNSEGVKKIEGLPANPTYVSLLKPPFIIEDGVPAVFDNKAYVIYFNGTSELTDFEFSERPSAYGMEATLIEYFAHDKKIYEYNVLAIILGGLLEELKSYLDDKVEQIESIATRSRNELISS